MGLESEPSPGQDRGMEEERSPERGHNVRIVLKFLRHGERDPEGKLTEYGRQVTRQRAQESGIGREDFDAVKAIGSPAGPAGPTGMARSLETADIYAREIAGDEAFASRRRSLLSYEAIVTPAPYDHVKIYNANLPANYDSLSEIEKAAAAKTAQSVVVNHLFALDSPEAEAFKKEVAGSFAYVIDHYQHVGRRLKDNSRVLIPAGSHGGMMEHLLQQALVRRDQSGAETVGFQDLSEIGGAFDPSEAFTVEVTTDTQGALGRMNVRFDAPGRPQTVEMYLDPRRLQDLRDFYARLHKLG